ncbi:hypothetical protein [Campylobacter lanienae]|uniref:hypothetical protein n=1 Tax=Campylobacter lanienae TaxID=75658 RepID=UPI002A91307C|nr:hypothetical protein [Campylobacter lanienae]MDY6134840.1 hypothetical protein [Campylobacter lanienae]
MDEYTYYASSYDEAKKQELEKLDKELEALEQDIDEKIEFIHQLFTKYSWVVKITPRSQNAKNFKDF